MPACLTIDELEEMAELGLEASSASASTHLEACPSCREKFAEVQDNLKLFDECQMIGIEFKSRGLALTGEAGTAPGAETAADRLRIPGYQILSEIRRGGQGVVYKAIQESANRTVALKVMLHGPYASRRQKRRFEREIDLVAGLRHPNIVTLYDSGQSDGRHYFAMEYIDGPTLRDYVKENQLSLGDRLRLIAKIAYAVAYAHARGIIHRDLKPSNIRIDAAGEPHVLDFGLAKSLEPELGGESLVTHSGEFFGTLAYASPEQVAGKPDAIDIRTDVYALGVMFYELMTDRRPYSVEGPMSLALRNINEAQPVRPSKIVGRLNDEIDTIVCKALDKEPDRRYRSADALAADVERYLAGEPIEAKADSGWYVLRKNMVRYRVAIGVAAAFGVVLFAGLVVSLWQWREAQANAEIAQHNATLAGVNFQRARDAVDQMLTEVGQVSLKDVPQMTPVRKALLEKALAFYEDLIREENDDPAVTLDTAQAYLRVADMTRILGQLDRSREAGRQAIALSEQLSATSPEEAQYQQLLVSALSQHAVLIKNEIEDMPQALKFYQRAFDLRVNLAAQYPDVVQYQRDLAFGYTNLGNVFYELGQYEKSTGNLRRGLVIHQQLAARHPEDRLALAHNHHWLGNVLMKSNQLNEAEEHFRACMDIRKVVLAESADNPRQRYDLAHIQLYLGQLLMKRGQAKEAAEAFAQAISNGNTLVEQFPSIPEYRKHLALNYGHLCEALISLNRFEAAEQTGRNGLVHSQYLVSNFPESGLYRKDFAWQNYRLAELLFRSGKHNEASDQFQLAFSQFDELLTRFPDNPRTYRHLGWLLVACPDARLQDPQRAATLTEKAIELKPDSPGLLLNLGLAYYRSGRWKDAADALSKASKDGFTWFIFAMAQSKLGNQDQASLFYEKALEWMEKNSPFDGDLQRLRTEAKQLLDSHVQSTTSYLFENMRHPEIEPFQACAPQIG